MRVVMFYHSLVSCWNHGNAHFLRGVVRELLARGHEVAVFEARNGWSRNNLAKDHGKQALTHYQRRYPELHSFAYSEPFDPRSALEGADLVIVHEWNSPELVARIGKLRRSHGFKLLFHDTHHRALSAPHEMERYDLSNYDGVLAFGRILTEVYTDRNWCERCWVWHEAADISVFFPKQGRESQYERFDEVFPPSGDVVWIGNFGDDERTQELYQFFIEPCAALKLHANVWGVRYPEDTVKALKSRNIRYHGWLANHRVPDAFAHHSLTVHVPRRHYTEQLPGIPTIRPFEALACGIPLISGPFDDIEGLFRVGQDFIMVHSEREMRDAMRAVLDDPDLAESLKKSGLETIRQRHTSAHRVDELMAIAEELGAAPPGASLPDRPLPGHSYLEPKLPEVS